MLRQEIGQRRRIQAASGDAETFAEAFGTVEHVVGNGECHFHTSVLPRYETQDEQVVDGLCPGQ
jgi:hypothetical protein